MTITTSGNNITLSSSGSGGGGSGTSFTNSLLTSSATGQSFYTYIIDSSSNDVTLTLPQSPTDGDEIRIKHKTKGTSYYLYIVPQIGHTIDDSTSTITSDQEKDAWHFVWYDTGSDWMIF